MYHESTCLLDNYITIKEYKFSIPNAEITGFCRNYDTFSNLIKAVN